MWTRCVLNNLCTYVFNPAFLKQGLSHFEISTRFCDHYDIMFPPLSFSLLLCLNWLCRWNEINNMSHNRSFFALELANREESVQFQTVSLHHCHIFLAPPILLDIIEFSQFDKFSTEPSASLNNAPVFVHGWGCNWPCLGMLCMRGF